MQNFVDDLGCAFALDQLDAGYLAPPGLHLFGANNVFQGPVCPLGQDMGPKELNQVEGGRLAELGDKTQLATFCLTADCGDSKLSVFLGSAGALVLSSLIAVLLGAAFSRFIPANYIKIAAGIFFVAVGIWTLYSAIKVA